MAVSNIANIFSTIDALTDNQLRMVKGYATDLLAERKTARQMAGRQAQNAATPVTELSEVAESRKKPEA